MLCYSVLHQEKATLVPFRGRPTVPAIPPGLMARPEQARNAVYTLARLLNPSDRESASSSKGYVKRRRLSPLLKALTSDADDARFQRRRSMLVSALSALAAFADCAQIFGASERGDKAVKFALETTLINHADDSDRWRERGKRQENHDE
jgi:hypothetical protein